MIQVNSISKSFGKVEAVKNVTFTAPDGQVTALLGANGAGKSTTLRTISGLIHPRQGTVKLAGKNIANPLGTVWSAALMLQHLDETKAAEMIMSAIDKTCSDGILPVDLGGTAGTKKIADAIAERL